MSERVLIVLSCGTDNPNRATRALFLAVTAHKKGKETAVFLLDDGVFIAKKGIAANLTAATGDRADDHLTYLQGYSVPILACTPCVKSRMFSESDLIEGARMAAGDEMIDLACESTVISL